MGRQAFGTRMVHREPFFANPVASSSARYPQELNPWSSGRSEPTHSSTAEKNENQTPVQDQRCQSGPSAKNPVNPSGGDSSKNYGDWKIRFKIEVCIWSQFPTEAMQWIKEVDMVDSVDDLRSSSSVRGLRMPIIWVLDARIASVLKRIIHNSHFKRRIRLERGTKGPEAGQFPSR